MVRPAEPIPQGSTFTTSLAYSGVPEAVPDPAVTSLGLPGVGWWRTPSAFHVLSECIGARSWFPCNDHPRDKATYSIAVTVPEPWVAAANGLLVEVVEGAEGRTYRWRAGDPMATYLATVNVGRFELREETGPDNPVSYTHLTLPTIYSV